jgi:hypothetical protein
VQFPNIIAAVADPIRYPPDSFAFTAIQGEGHTQFGAVLATKLKAVRTPTRIAGFHGLYEDLRCHRHLAQHPLQFKDLLERIAYGQDACLRISSAFVLLTSLISIELPRHAEAM